MVTESESQMDISTKVSPTTISFGEDNHCHFYRYLTDQITNICLKPT